MNCNTDISLSRRDLQDLPYCCYWFQCKKVCITLASNGSKYQ